MTGKVMTIENLGQTMVPWMDAVHSQARSKGWWENFEKGGLLSRNLGEIFFLIKTELAEAYEEWRKPDSSMTRVYEGEKGKPEGIPIELADAVIRMLDTAAACNLLTKGEFTSHLDLIMSVSFNMRSYLPVVENFGEALDNVANRLTRARLAFVSVAPDLNYIGTENPERYHGAVMAMKYPLLNAIDDIFEIAEKHGMALGSAISIKHAFNGTRPHRHGGKKS